MKNSKKLLAFRRKAGIIALIAIIGFTMAACGGNDDPGNDPNGPNGPSGPSRPEPFTLLQDIAEYLASAEGGADADDPVYLPVKMTFGQSLSDYILIVIETADKYVELDLTSSTIGMSYMGFVPYDPYTYEGKGKEKIVSLTLPITVTKTTGVEMVNGKYRPALSSFPALRSFSGAGLERIEDSTFDSEFFDEETGYHGNEMLASVTLGEVTYFHERNGGSGLLRDAVMAQPEGSRAGTYTRDNSTVPIPDDVPWTKQ